MRDLPLASSWNAGTYGDGTTGRGLGPREHLELARGGAWLPVFGLPLPGPTSPYHAGAAFRESFEAVRDLELPITLESTQLEDALRRSVWPGGTWHELTGASSGLALELNGQVEEARRVDPFGPLELWREIGEAVLDSDAFRWIVGTYIDPMRVVMLSNNESPTRDWRTAETSARYLELHGPGRDYDYRVMAHAVAKRDRQEILHAAMRRSMPAAWRTSSSFVGYKVAGAPFLGRMDGWRDYVSYFPGHLCHGLGWDGGSQHELYLGQSDVRWYSPQGQACGLPAQDAITDRARPDWWREVSVWEQTADYREANYPGGAFTPDRFAGMVRWLLWIVRPRVLRHFHLHAEPLETVRPWLDAVVRAVREVHELEELAAFWREGELVTSPKPSPYSFRVPEELEASPRNFALATDLDPDWDPGIYPTQWGVPVWACALRRGDDFLVYAQAPLGARDVRVTIPNAGEVLVDAPPEGAFYLVSYGWQARRVI